MTAKPLSTFALSAAALAALAVAGCKSTGGTSPSAPPPTQALHLADAPLAKAVERAGVVTVRGKPLTLLGSAVNVGDAAPAFAAVANDMSPFTFAPAAGKVTILASVPSVDTPTCSTETKRFNEEAGKIGGDVSVVTVSMDLPFAQKRWCAAEGVKNLQTVSDFKDREFGAAYGVRIKENGLLARAVWVVGKDGKVAYAQVVPELSAEPDYAAALEAAKKAASAK